MYMTGMSFPWSVVNIAAQQRFVASLQACHFLLVSDKHSLGPSLCLCCAVLRWAGLGRAVPCCAVLHDCHHDGLLALPSELTLASTGSWLGGWPGHSPDPPVCSSPARRPQDPPSPARLPRDAGCQHQQVPLPATIHNELSMLSFSTRNVFLAS